VKTSDYQYLAYKQSNPSWAM